MRNIDDTERHKIIECPCNKHRTVCIIKYQCNKHRTVCVIEYPSNKHKLMPKYQRDMRAAKTEKNKFLLANFLKPIPDL